MFYNIYLIAYIKALYNYYTIFVKIKLNKSKLVFYITKNI